MGALRIALAGPEATGKTSLARGLSQALGLDILEDPRPALLARRRCHTLFEAAKFGNVWQELLETQLEREAEAPAAIILDTCSVDCWVLWQRWAWNKATPERAEQLYRATRAATERLSHIVVMPPVQIAEPTGPRFLNPDYAQQIARLTHSFLNESGLSDRSLTLSSGPGADAVDTVLQASGLSRVVV